VRVNRQTDRQTNAAENRTPATTIGVNNKKKWSVSFRSCIRADNDDTLMALLVMMMMMMVLMMVVMYR